MVNLRTSSLVCALLLFGIGGGAAFRALVTRLGKQDDSSYLVSTGQRIPPGQIKFRGRPSNLALHPNGKMFAVLSKNEIFLATETGIVEGSKLALSDDCGYRGISWNPDGSVLAATSSNGDVLLYTLAGSKLSPLSTVKISDSKRNPVPGALAFSRDGKNLYVSAADLNQACVVDVSSGQVSKRYQVGNIPFGAFLSPDGRQLVVTNWGGRLPEKGDRTAKSEDADVVVDQRGSAATGTINLIDLATGRIQQLSVGIHPTDVAFDGNKAYVANSMSDSISEVDLNRAKVTRTLSVSFKKDLGIGAMPVALEVSKGTLFVCNGGDNALAELDLKSGSLKGLRPTGFYPIGLKLSGDHGIVLNSKGNGSVANTAYGRIGNVHDFEGSISILDLSKPIKTETGRVVHDNNWDTHIASPALPVYNGAIKHVVYIIKENRTYDEIYGDMPEGNGDPTLAALGAKVMPNHQQIARNFTLFDNAYVSGTNSNDGHAWSTEALANDYQERFYVGYSRTYGDDGNCCMSLSTGGAIWDAALMAGKTLRDYGEFCVADDATYQPRRPKDWFEAWQDRQSGEHKFHYVPHCRVASLAPYVHPSIHYWPLIQSDQDRADEFIKDYRARILKDTVPNLMIMSLPSDHTEGLDPNYPKPESMMADNDLALGRVIEAVSKGPQWKETAIFVIEDDAQSGPDHVDGHRTSFLVVSPYTKRHFVDHSFYTTLSMIRSMELILGIKPMNRFDAVAAPIVDCFNSTPDLTPYSAVPNQVPLGQMNPGRTASMTPREKLLQRESLALDWSEPDAPNPEKLNHIL